MVKTRHNELDRELFGMYLRKPWNVLDDKKNFIEIAGLNYENYSRRVYIFLF